MIFNIQDFLVGFVISGLFAVLLQRGNSLTLGGRLAAVLLGTVIYAFAGLPWLAIALVFFVSSSFLSNFKSSQKEKLSDKFEKVGARDFWQVLANGGLSAIFAIASNFLNPAAAFAAFVGIIASVNADTWATEIGVLSKKKPRLVTTGKPVETGTSGAISLIGTLATIAGAFLIGITALFVLPFIVFAGESKFTASFIVLIAVVAGLAASVTDSVLGAMIQAKYYCNRCRKETERHIHSCGARTKLVRGFPFFDNDAVNLASSMLGAVVATALYLWL